ncbi:MAG: nuclear transport factor 2 family protein [Alphaproteobacteria bacterium]
MSTDLEDRLTIRALVENWVVWRDAGMWDRFRSVWHDDGVMVATWTQGTADEFIAMSRAGFENGINVHHFLGGNSIELSGDRAVSMTKMTIAQRAEVHDVLVDVVCTGRFYDFLERRAGRWGFVLRQPIYEKDRMDPVDPAAELKLDKDVLDSYPEGYRHLAYLQSRNSMDVKRDLPGVRGSEVEALYKRGQAWLEGADSPF